MYFMAANVPPASVLMANVRSANAFEQRASVDFQPEVKVSSANVALASVLTAKDAI